MTTRNFILMSDEHTLEHPTWGGHPETRERVAAVCARFGQAVALWAADFAGGRIVTLLEGGYHIDALCDSVEQYLLGLSRTPQCIRDHTVSDTLQAAGLESSQRRGEGLAR